MANQLPFFDPENIGRRRLPDNKIYRAQLNTGASSILDVMLDLIASNYPKDPSSNLSIFFRVMAREIARQQDSMNFINNDKVFTQTRIEYIQQILGERLFLNNQLAPSTKDDVSYRKFLIAIKDAYLKGSKKSTIETIINQFTNLKVNIRELYLEARKPFSAVELVDTHKMVIELFIDDLIAGGLSITDINNSLAFFVNLVKPAHVLYDTKQIWTENIQVNKIHDIYFGDTGGGCVPKYIWTPFGQKTVLALKIQVVDPSTMGPDIFEIGTIQPENLIIYLTNDTKVIIEPGTEGTQFFGTNGRRILFTDLLIGQKIRLVYQEIPGDFNFYYMPPDLVTDYDSRFYKDVYRKGAFQEFVKKEMDSKGRYSLQIASDPTTICDRWVQDAIQPMYEDLRENCKKRTETAAIYSVPLAPRMWSPRFNIEDGIDTTNERPLLGDLYSFTMPYSPLVDSSGNPATPSAISVLKDGTNLVDSVQHVGANFTNEIIDGTTIVRAGDTTLSGIYFNSPHSNLTAWNLTPGDSIRTTTLHTAIHIGHNFDSTHGDHTTVNYYTYADTSNFHISKILNSTSVLLDAPVTYDATFSSSKFNYRTESPYISLFDMADYWSTKYIDGTTIAHAGDTTLTGISFDSPYVGLTALNLIPGDYIKTNSSSFKIVQILDTTSVVVNVAPTFDATFSDSVFRYHKGSAIIGDEFQFNYHYLAADGSNTTTDTEFIFGISYWELPGAPISNGLGTDLLALPSDVILSVDGTVIPDAVIDIEAVRGFVTVEDKKDFWLASPLGRVPIPSSRIDGTNYSGDTFTFSYYKSGSTKYAIIFDDPSRDTDDSMVFDGAESDPYRTPVPEDTQLQIGYKFRADLLHHAAVLNSSDTLLLNNYQKPAKRASIINRQDTLNHYNYFFSPEFLTDKTFDGIFNDKYLDKDIPAAVTLNAGTPTFQQTYSYQPGLIKHNKLIDIRKNHNLLMYCDLLLKETRSGNDEVHLSSICDNEPLRFNVRFNEEMLELSECSDWVIFDTAETKQIEINIPGNYDPNPNLRVLDLRDNFILRDMTSTGLTTIDYVYYEHDNFQNDFQLPDTTRVTVDGINYDFPALPVMHDKDTLATAGDVIVSIDGVVTPGIIDSFDPITGEISLYPQADLTFIENIRVTQEMIDNRHVKLAKYPLSEEDVVVNVSHGPMQIYSYDFVVHADILFFERPFRSHMSPGDILTVIYTASSQRYRTIKFTYDIKSTAKVSIIDNDRSRIFDDDDTFPYFCYDGYQQTVDLKYTEYINFLNDNSKGIKFTYFNKDNHQIEEHTFSGPVFESYSALEDEISAIESFPNALVRIANPLGIKNPLEILPNYDFLNNKAVRIRKKTINELLPDRTFKTTKIYEAMPV